MNNTNYYAFIEQVNKEDTNILNYHLFTGQYENCPKNNRLINIDVDTMIKKDKRYIDQSIINYKNTYLIKLKKI